MKRWILLSAAIWFLYGGVALAQEKSPSEPGVVEVQQILKATGVAAQSENANLKKTVSGYSDVMDQARVAGRTKGCQDESAGSLRLAVYNFQLDGIPAGMGRLVTASLLSEVRKLAGLYVIGMQEINEMLQHEKTKEVMGCSDDSCLAEIAGALGVDEIITGQLTERADGRVMIIRRINQRRAEVVTSVSRRLKIGNGEEFLLAVGPAVEELYPERENLPGTKRGVAKTILLRMDPPPIPTWMTYTALGVTALIAAGSGGLVLAGNSAVANREEILAGSRLKPVSGLDVQSQDNLINGLDAAAKAGWIGAGCLLISSAVMSLFTDWQGYGQNESEEDL